MNELSKRGRFLIFAAILVALPLTYVLSYAPAVKYANGMGGDVAYGLYKPVEWLIDDTPFKAPLFLWARLWGIEEDMDIWFQLRYWRRKYEESVIRNEKLRSEKVYEACTLGEPIPVDEP